MFDIPIDSLCDLQVISSYPLSVSFTSFKLDNVQLLDLMCNMRICTHGPGLEPESPPSSYPSHTLGEHLNTPRLRVHCSSKVRVDRHPRPTIAIAYSTPSHELSFHLNIGGARDKLETSASIPIANLSHMGSVASNPKSPIIGLPSLSYESGVIL